MRDIQTLPLPPQQISKLKETGYIMVKDLIDIKPSQLNKETGMRHEECLEIIQLARRTENSPKNDDFGQHVGSLTALELLKQESQLLGVKTMCQELDRILGGGVQLTKITEFCGAPGVGKTQLGMQLAVDVQMPSPFGGLAGEAVYIDTEGSLVVERLSGLAQALVAHCTQIANSNHDKVQQEALQLFTVESILSGIHIYRCLDYAELLATVNLLPAFLKEHGRVRLVVVDSIAFPFRHQVDDFSQRTRILNGLAQDLIRIAANYKLAVVLTNQMTTKMGTTSSHLVPALGESWGHASTIRVLLHWKNAQRFAILYKSPFHQEAEVPYQITEDGVRSIASAGKSNSQRGQRSPAPDDKAMRPPKKPCTGVTRN